MVRQALDHEGRRGEDERRLARAATDETGQRQHRCENYGQRENSERRQVADEQAAFKSQTQPGASCGGFGFGGRERERVGPE